MNEAIIVEEVQVGKTYKRNESFKFIFVVPKIIKRIVYLALCDAVNPAVKPWIFVYRFSGADTHRAVVSPDGVVWGCRFLGYNKDVLNIGSNSLVLSGADLDKEWSDLVKKAVASIGNP